jgi:GT2 family glycosyltransferase
MDLSVIIVSYNVRAFLEQSLLSVRKASRGISAEVIVTDNNSSDGSCEMVEKNFPDVRLIRNTVNVGYAAANNQAIREASGRYILLLNPDTIVGEDTFSKCLSFMDNNPDAGALGVMMVDGRGRYLPESKRALPSPGAAFFKMTGFHHIFPRSGIFNRYYHGDLDKTKISRIEVIAGAFMFLRKEAVIKTGLLDEEFFMYGEDIDYSLRLIKAGYKNYYYPETRIVHFKGCSTRQKKLRAVIWFYKAMAVYVRKHYSSGSEKLLKPVLLAAIILIGTLSLFKHLIINIFRGRQN